MRKNSLTLHESRAIAYNYKNNHICPQRGCVKTQVGVLRNGSTEPFKRCGTAYKGVM
jgi:hypothetical protein